MDIIEVEKVKNYLRVDFSDDDEIISLMLDVVMEELEQLLPKFDRNAPTSRQRLLIYASVKDLYDNRGKIYDKKGTQESMRFAIQSMMLKEMLG